MRSRLVGSRQGRALRQKCAETTANTLLKMLRTSSEGLMHVATISGSELDAFKPLALSPLFEGRVSKLRRRVQMHLYSVGCHAFVMTRVNASDGQVQEIVVMASVESVPLRPQHL